MSLSNALYYATRDPLGAAGDFTTAPEIGQMFGEIVGAALRTGVRAGSFQSPGGLVSAHIRLDGAGQDGIREILFTGDFFVAPPRLIFDLESSLRGVSIAAAPDAIGRFFAALPAGGLLSIGPGDFSAAFETALVSDPASAPA